MRLAVVPELCDLRAQAERGACSGAAPRRPLRPGRPAGRDHGANEARVRLQPEQPDGHDELARRARRLLRASAGPRADRARSGVLRVRRRARLRGRHRGVLQGGPAGDRVAHVLEDLRTRRRTGGLWRRSGRARHCAWEDAASVRPDDTGAGRRARQPGFAPRARAQAAGQCRRPCGARADSDWSGLQGDRAGRRKLRLRRPGRGRAALVRGVAARRCDRAAARRVRRAQCDPRDGRNAGGPRVPGGSRLLG